MFPTDLLDLLHIQVGEKRLRERNRKPESRKEKKGLELSLSVLWLRFLVRLICVAVGASCLLQA